MAEWQSDFVSTNGIRMHYWRTGSGDKTPIVFSHGGSDNGLCWTRAARALEADYDVIMVDARGHGLSDKTGTDYGPRQSAADLAGLIGALDLDHPHLVGHSMGGEISSNCAADFPDIPRSLVILDSAYIGNDGPWASTADETGERLASFRKRAEEMRDLGMDGLLELVAKQSPNWHPDELEPWAQSKLQASPEVGRFFSQAKRPWQEIIGAITCPILLLVAEPHLGSHTQWEAAVQATGIWKQGQLVHIPDAGHNLQRDQYDLFMTRLRTWLETH